MTDTVLGGGDDFWLGSEFADNISGGAGNDTIYGDDGSDTLFGAAGNDQLEDGSSGDKDQYFGGAGNDRIVAGAGDFGDIVDGGADDDILYLNYSFLQGAQGVYISGNSIGFARVNGLRGISWSNIETFSIGGTQGADTIYGSAGNDTLQGVDGHDSLYGRAGDDYLAPGEGNFLVYGGGGYDLLVLNAVTEAVHWEVGDTWSFTNGDFAGRADSVERLMAVGGAGGDQFVGGDLVDTLNGGAGDDTLSGGAGNDRINGSTGSDLIYGDSGDDSIDDTVATESGVHDQFFGGTGNDLISAGAGMDSVYGGDGNDALSSQGAGSLLRGGAGDDFLTAYDFGMTLDAGSGNDRVSVGVKGAGSTLLLSGGGGTDILGRSLDFNTGKSLALETVLLANGTMRFLVGGVLADQATGFEVFSLAGGAVGDTLRGGAGNDSLTGYAYNDPALDHDYLSGKGGDDVLIGRAGRDTLLGGDGDDRLDGGLQQDQLSGGLGKDVFVFTTALDSDVTVTRDLITDFIHLTDKIDLSAIDAAPDDPLIDSFTFIKRAQFDHHAGELRYVVGTSQTQIQGDIDGDAKADFSITLTGRITLTFVDFVL